MITQVHAITEDIIEKYERKLLDKIINTHYFYFLNYEKVKIVDKALRRLSQNEDEAANLRLDIIREKLEEYLEDEIRHSALDAESHTASSRCVGFAGQARNDVACGKTLPLQNIEGFVRFRLREYYSVLETVVDDAAQEYLIEREYEEFIGLLKYFVEISESKLPLLYIVSGNLRGYKFLDHNKNDITDECLADFLEPIENDVVPIVESINQDDMLISTLIMLAPAKILWYGADEYSEIAETVRKIFENKVEFYGNG